MLHFWFCLKHGYEKFGKVRLKLSECNNHLHPWRSLWLVFESSSIFLDLHTRKYVYLFLSNYIYIQRANN